MHQTVRATNSNVQRHSICYILFMWLPFHVKCKQVPSVTFLFVLTMNIIFDILICMSQSLILLFTCYIVLII